MSTPADPLPADPGPTSVEAAPAGARRPALRPPAQQQPQHHGLLVRGAVRVVRRTRGAVPQAHPRPVRAPLHHRGRQRRARRPGRAGGDRPPAPAWRVPDHDLARTAGARLCAGRHAAGDQLRVPHAEPLQAVPAGRRRQRAARSASTKARASGARACWSTSSSATAAIAACCACACSSTRCWRVPPRARAETWCRPGHARARSRRDRRRLGLRRSGHVQPVNLLGISGSLRRGSYSTALLRAAQSLAAPEASLEVATLHDIPLYDGDLEQQHGLHRRGRGAQGAGGRLRRPAAGNARVQQRRFPGYSRTRSTALSRRPRTFRGCSSARRWRAALACGASSLPRRGCRVAQARLEFRIVIPETLQRDSSAARRTKSMAFVSRTLQFRTAGCVETVARPSATPAALALPRRREPIAGVPARGSGGARRSVLARIADGQRHVAQVDMAGGLLVPVVAAVAAGLDQFGEQRRAGAQHLAAACARLPARRWRGGSP